MKAYELLANRETWTTRAYARDNNDTPVSELSESAVRWCADGALGKCYTVKAGEDWDNREYTEMRKKVLGYIQENTNYSSIITFNDFAGYEEVLRVFTHLRV